MGKWSPANVKGIKATKRNFAPSPIRLNLDQAENTSMRMPIVG